MIGEQSEKRVAGDFLSGALVFDDRNTLGEIAHELARGRTGIVRRGARWYLITSALVAGWPPTRRLIDLPLHEIEPLRADLSLDDAFGRFVSHRVEELPVVDGDRCLGVVSRGAIDDYRQARQRQRETTRTLRRERLAAMGELAGGAAHGLNNLLTAILGFASHLEGSIDPFDARMRSVTGIRRAAERATELARSLLGLSRFEPSSPQVLSINAVLAGLEGILRQLLREDIRLVIVTCPDLGTVRVDPIALDQVILDLVVNARDAMPRGGEILVRTANVEVSADRALEEGVPPGRYVSLAVVDTGSGIDTATLPRIFEPFFTTKETGRGTGIGLSCVLEFVSKDGGHISVESETGAGTTFRLLYPRSAGEIRPATRPRRDTRMPEGSETILVVEDDAMVREVVRETLVALGYTVIEARDGKEGLEVARRRSSDIQLVVADVVLPWLSGKDLVDRLQSGLPTMRFLFMSGYGPAVRVGIEGSVVLRKPFRPEELATSVREALDQPLPGRSHGNE